MRFFQKRSRRHEIDMTEGPLLPKILSFSGPLILTGIMQLLYNAADVIVVGNYAEGHTALAAVSSTGSMINLLVNVFMGLSVGASVVIARYYGARDVPGMRKAADMIRGAAAASSIWARSIWKNRCFCPTGEALRKRFTRTVSRRKNSSLRSANRDCFSATTRTATGTISNRNS